MPRLVRVVMASERLASVTDTSQHFMVLRVDFAKGQAAVFSGPSGYAYVLSGQVAVTGGGAQRALAAGEAAFLRTGETATLRNSAAGSAALVHFLLVPGSALDRTPYAGAAKVTELYRTTERIPRLEAGPYEFSLTKVTSPAKVKPPPHHRSGAAVYYVLSGSGTLHMESRSEPRKAGAVQYEPNGFVHTWENSSAASLVLLQANLSREGAPEIIWLR